VQDDPNPRRKARVNVVLEDVEPGWPLAVRQRLTTLCRPGVQVP
jgi:hypothetical protein